MDFELIGKWKSGQGGYMIWEFKDDLTFRYYTTTSGISEMQGEYLATGGTLSLLTADGGGVNNYEVSGSVLRIYPSDGGSPIICERT